MMKAIVYTEYGLPDVLQLKEIEKPTLEDDEVLVEVHATSVNSADATMSKGEPFLARLWSGLLKPKYPILGSDIAGRVQAVGRNVKEFQAGDEVFGDISGSGWGGFAEYVAVPENTLALKPANITFEEAAATPQAAIVALQGLRDKGQIESRKKVLINGASGGIGTFAVQIAKSFGAEVTGVCSSRNLDMVRSIGADHVIDYTQVDFTQNGQRYDLIFTVVGHHSIFDFKRVLSPEGIYVGSVNSTALIFQTMLLVP
jgi:NADPH:quinone reductase-like Zn-dependent oxidoreductase